MDVRICWRKQRAIDVNKRGEWSSRGSFTDHEMGGWPHVAELTRTRTEKGKPTLEVVYLISTLPAGRPAPQHLLELSRGHWSIETACTMCVMSPSLKITPASALATLLRF